MQAAQLNGSLIRALLTTRLLHPQVVTSNPISISNPINIKDPNINGVKNTALGEPDLHGSLWAVLGSLFQRNGPLP